MKKSCAIVIGGKNVNSTGLIRSLGQAGVSVTFASRSSVIESKYTRDYLLLPEKQEQWLAVLQKYIQAQEGKVALFPTDDESAFFLDDHCSELQALVPHAGGRLRQLADKTQMAELARKSGLAIPEYALVPCDRWQGSFFGYPVILKPYAGFAGSKGDIRICHSAEEFAAAMERYTAKGYPSILQQRLLESPGQYEVGIIGLALPDGRVVMPGTIRKIRSYPTGRGSTSYARFQKGLPVEEQLLADFVRSTGYVGLFDVEMMIAGDQAWFLEINYRNGQYGYTATAAGYNLAENWLRGMLGQEIDTPDGVQEITYINERDDYLHVKEGTVSRKQWMREFHGATAYGMFCKGDQRPFIRQFVKIPDRVVIAWERLKDLLVKEEWNVAIRPRGDKLLFEEGGREQPFRVVKNSLRYWAADPFILSKGEKDYLFFEMYDRFQGKGVIGCREIADGRIGKMQVVYEAPTHLSFPFMFEHDGCLYMMPESSKSRELPVLKTAGFPGTWEPAENLMAGKRLVDSVLYAQDGTAYLLTHEIDQRYAFDTLDVYFREAGAWKPHPNNPVVVSGEKARLAGRVFDADGAAWRVAQDCSESYGKQISFSRIQVLSPWDYQEQTEVTVSAEEIRCPHRQRYDGIHTYNFSDRYEVIDLRNRGRVRLGNVVNILWRLVGK